MKIRNVRIKDVSWIPNARYSNLSKLGGILPGFKTEPTNYFFSHNKSLNTKPREIIKFADLYANKSLVKLFKKLHHGGKELLLGSGVGWNEI